MTKSNDGLVLTAALRVKNEAKNLPRCLANLEKFCDHIVAYDDGSTDDTLKILDSHPLVRHVVSMQKGYYHETHDRSIALALATLTKPDWIIKMDADETLDDFGAANIRRLMKVPGIKAWTCHRFNFVDGETQGDAEIMHPLLFRHEPGKVFYFNIKFHKAFPNVDKIPGGWGRVNFRVKHYGYVDKTRKLAEIDKMGYTYGDYLTPYFNWDEDIDRPFLWQRVDRPPAYAATEPIYEPQLDAGHYGHQRFPDFEDKADFWLHLADLLIHDIDITEASQSINQAAQLIDEGSRADQRIQLAFYQSLLQYLRGQFTGAAEGFTQVAENTADFWPMMNYWAGWYLNRIARQPIFDANTPAECGLLPPARLMQHWRQIFVKQFTARINGPVVFFGGGHHTLVMDDEGHTQTIQPVGLVEELHNMGSIAAPRMSLEDASKIDNSILLFSGFNDRGLWKRTTEFGENRLCAQSIYSPRPNGGPFWFDEYANWRKKS